MAGTSAIEWTEAPEIPYGDVPESQSRCPPTIAGGYNASTAEFLNHFRMTHYRQDSVIVLVVEVCVGESSTTSAAWNWICRPPMTCLMLRFQQSMLTRRQDELKRG